MSALPVFVLGVLVGVILVWPVFSIYWRHWRGYLTRDMGHVQAKVKSVEATNIGLERQLTAQKTDLAGMRSKINTLETENRLAQARVQGVEAEKQSLSEHLNTLRAELAAYKALITEAGRVQMPGTNGKNGHAQQPSAERSNGAAPKLNGTAPPARPSQKKDANGGMLAPEFLAAFSALSQDVLATPASNGAAKNGSTAYTPLYRSSYIPDLPPEQRVMPEIHIARPRMGGDRLEIIQGIGPTMVKKLDAAGIDSFRTLAALTPERLKEIIGPRLARIADVDKIIHQAQRIIGE